MLIRNTSGEVIRRIPAPHSKGFHRVETGYAPSIGGSTRCVHAQEMDLEPNALRVSSGARFLHSFACPSSGWADAVDPGPVSFELKPLRKGALEGGSMEEVDAFWRGLEAASGRTDPDCNGGIGADRAGGSPAEWHRNAVTALESTNLLFVLRKEIQALRTGWSGEPLKLQMGEKTPPWSPNVYSFWCAV